MNWELAEIQDRSGKGQRNQRSNWQYLLDHRKSKRIPEKHLLLFHWLNKNLCVDHNKLWKILREMGIPDHLTCLLRNMYAGQEETVRTREKQTGSKLGKGYVKALYSHPTYLTSLQSTSCKMPGWMKHKLGLCRWYHPFGGKRRGTKEPLDEDKRG